MGRPSYVCTVCSEHFTRKSSAKRHNNNLHNGAAETVRLIDYLAGRSSGQYLYTIHPSWYKRNIGSRTVADTVGETFEPGYLPQQISLGRSQHNSSPIPRTPLSGMDGKYGTGLSQDNIIKIQELKILAYKYRQYQNNDPDVIVEWAVQGASDGDTKFLDDKLEQLRTMDRRLNGRPGPFTVF
jgi:hypothetical protein